MDENTKDFEHVISRREFVTETSLAGILVAGGFLTLSGCGDLPPPPKSSSNLNSFHNDLTLSVNGVSRTLTVDTRTTLLDLLRNELKLTGTKKGCDHGQCGACTVLVNGVALNSCLALASIHGGAAITTVEGLGASTDFSRVQDAFVKLDALQCGYCTPGQVVSACALVAKKKPCAPSEIREFMSGNICRCGAYPHIVAAVQSCLPASA